MDEMMKPGMDQMAGMGEMPDGQPMDADPMAKLKQAKALIEEAMAAMGGETEADDGRMGMEEAFGKGFQGY